MGDFSNKTSTAVSDVFDKMRVEIERKGGVDFAA